MAIPTVSMTELRRNLARIMREVEAGGIYRITRHGRVIAYIVPPWFTETTP
jgi:prevent-host-death family protein